MEKSTAERQVLAHITDLVAEEHRLLDNRATLAEAGHERLARIQVELDQCWDLLRQRRALRETGADPDHAQVRAPDIVEKYTG